MAKKSIAATKKPSAKGTIKKLVKAESAGGPADHATPKLPSIVAEPTRTVPLTAEEINAERALRSDELRQQRQAAEEVRQKWRDRLLKRNDVTGLHVGLKRKDGKVATPLQYVLCIHVETKRLLNDPYLKEPLQSDYDGVPTDIIEMSYRKTSNDCDDDSLPEHKRLRSELTGGIAISRELSHTNWGTLGMVVYQYGLPRLLTNQHVAGNEGDEIRNPPMGRCSMRPGREQLIGDVVLQQLSFSVDCAIIRPDGKRPVKGGILGLPGDQDSFIDGELQEGDENVAQVFKVGAKTGFDTLRKGRVVSVRGDVHIPGHGSFMGQIIVETVDPAVDISQGGDSGSVLLRAVTVSGVPAYQVVGLVHAETEASDHMVACHFRDVKKALEISLHPDF